MTPQDLGKFLSTLTRQDMVRLLADLALATPGMFDEARDRQGL